MSIKSTSYPGDLSAGRNLTCGGDLSVRGNAVVNSNLRVSGWLEARNVKCANKGVFGSEQELKESYARPRPGWWALVAGEVDSSGAVQSWVLYVSKANKWIALGETGFDITIDNSIYDTLVTELRDSLDSLEGDVSELNREMEGFGTSLDSVKKQLSEESEAREDGDNALSVRIDGIVSSKVIDITEIDTLPASKDDAIAWAKDASRVRYAVTSPNVSGKVRLTVGVLDVFSDNMGHVLTEVLTTHYAFNNDGELDFSVHSDDKIYVYYRSYGISNSNISPEGGWSAWKKYVPEEFTELAIAVGGLSEKVEGMGDVGTELMRLHKQDDELLGMIRGLTLGVVPVLSNPEIDTICV